MIERKKYKNLFNKEFYNVCILGTSFLLIFSAFFPTSVLSVAALSSAFNNPDSGYDLNNPLISNIGYYGLLTLYISFLLVLPISPSIVALLTPKWCLFFSSFTYFTFTAAYIFPTPASIYVAAVLIGIGAGGLWTSQGKLLNINSSEKTIDRNSAIFWALFSQSWVWSSLFIFIYLGDLIEFSSKQRYIIYSTLTGIGMLGSFCVLLISVRNTKTNDEVESKESNYSLFKKHLLNSLKQIFETVKFFKYINTWLLLSVFMLTGFTFNAVTGLYSACIGNVKAAGFSIRYISFTALMIGIGEIIGSLLIALNSRLPKRIPRWLIYFIIVAILTINNLLIYLNLPENCNYPKISTSNDINISNNSGQEVPKQFSEGGVLIVPSQLSLALINGFFYGMVDSVTQIFVYAAIQVAYDKEKSAQANALFKFVQTIAVIIAFFYNPLIDLHFQLGINLLFGIIASFCYLAVELKCKTRNKTHPPPNNVTENIKDTSEQNMDRILVIEDLT